jgi:hypothetical protein
LRARARGVRHGDDQRPIQPVHHSDVGLLAVSFRDREQREASQILMLKQVRLLSQG